MREIRQATPRWGRALAALGATTAILLGTPSLAPAQTYPPVDTPGPALSVPQATLDAALDCSTADLSTATRPPVLLVPGTSLTPEKNYDWNWIPALDDLGWEWCAVELPGSSMADIQIAAEYVVNAIRTMSEEYDPIDVLGHSQGGMVPRWALRFWPDTRAMVDDLVGIAPSNHGTTASLPNMGCPFQGCAPAIWQQLATSGFIAALNSHQETFPGIDYTAIYTTADDVVQPNANDDSGSSSLRPGDTAAITNVAVQDVCTDPNAPYTNHAYVGTVNNAAYLLAVDGLDNPGPANPTRPDFTGGACTSPMPGVNLMTGNQDAADAQTYSNNTVATYPKVNSEPLVACYAVSPCGPQPGPGGGGGGSTQPVAAGKRAAAIKKCKKKKRKARANCLKKAKKLPV